MTTPDTFTAATWNAAGGTKNPPSAQELDPVVRRLRRLGVTVILGQEMQDDGVRRMLRSHGFALYLTPPQYVVAWLREDWVGVSERDVKLAKTLWDRAGGQKDVETKMAQVILCDRLGRSLTVGSYHTPPSVQKPNPPARRVQALRESAATWGRLADEAETRAVMFGGDDNVDEGRGPGQWSFMRQAATGLRQVQAPRPTAFGKRIDDFRVRGLVPGKGRVLNVPGDHHVHVRDFAWR